MMVVDLMTELTVEVGRPRVLFDWPYGVSRPLRAYDVSNDGQRFLVRRREEQDPEPRGHLRFIDNWFEELTARVPTN